MKISGWVDFVKSVEACEKNYKELESRLKGRQGEQILVVTQYEAIQGCPGIISPKYIDPIFICINTHLQLGVLSLDQIERSDKEKIIKKAILPTDKYVEKELFPRGRWELKNKPLDFYFDYLAVLGEELKRRDTPVANSIELNRKGLLVCLGPEVEQYFDIKNRVVSYVEGLELLNHEVPEKSRKKYDEIILHEKLAIVDELEGLILSENKIRKDIESAYGSIDRRPQSGGNILYSIGPELPGPSEEEIKLATFGKRKELEHIASSAKSSLEKAVELGMHKTDLVVEGKIKGISITVKDFIVDLCEKYNVRIP